MSNGLVHNSIGISGLPGAGKSTLIKMISEEFDFGILAVGDMFRNKFEDWLDDPRNKNKGEVRFDDWWAKIVTQEEIEEVNTNVRCKLIDGHIVLDSRYVPVNCLNLDIPQVFLTAPLMVRAKRLIGNKRYLGKNILQIADTLQKRESDEFTRGNAIYGYLFRGHFDYREIRHYNQVIDTSSNTFAQEMEIVERLLMKV